MKERISTHYPTALEAAAEERRLQLEAAIIFDAQEYNDEIARKLEKIIEG